MKISNHTLLATGLFAFMTVACSPGKVISTELGPGIQEQNYQTYNFYDLKVQTPDSAPANPQRIQMLKDAISRELEAVGLKKETNPDLWVNIGVVVEEKIQTRETDIRDDLHWSTKVPVEGRGGARRQVPGSKVTIDLVDAALDEMIGQAVASDVIVDKLKKRIDQVAEKVFNKLWESAD